jgi:hypothetical protein
MDPRLGPRKVALGHVPHAAAVEAMAAMAVVQEMAVAAMGRRLESRSISRQGFK